MTTIFYYDEPGKARDGELIEMDVEVNDVAFDFEDSDAPRGALIVRVAVAMLTRSSRIERIDLKKRRARCQFENEKFFT